MKRQTIFYFVIGITALIIAASPSYYFVIFLPQRNEDVRIFAANQKCRETGEKIYKEDSQKHGMNTPEYIFNAKLNTCLYASGWGRCEGDICVTYDFVKDILTNKNIIYSGYVGDKNNGLSGEEFNKQKQELFR